MTSRTIKSIQFFSFKSFSKKSKEAVKISKILVNFTRPQKSNQVPFDLSCLASVRVSDPYEVMFCRIKNNPSPKSEVVHETKFSLKFCYSTLVCSRVG